MTGPIPEGYGTVTPYLVVDDEVGLVDLLKAAFDAEVRHLLQREDGSVCNAEVQVGDSRIMMGEARSEYPARPTDLYMYVPDCDAVFAKAVEAGGTVEDVSPEEALRRSEQSG